MGDVNPASKNKRVALTVITAMTAMSLCCACRADTVRSSDYAYGATLEMDAAAALYVTTLAEEQYRHTAHADLTDMCVVNAANEVVPFALRRPVVEQRAPEDFKVLPLFPLRSDDRSPSEALKLRLRSGSTSLEVEQPMDKDKAFENVAAYLLDLRALEQPIATLHLAWADDAPDFSKRLSVEFSEDLTHWYVLIGAAPIVNLHYAGQEFVRADVAVRDLKTSFLRLSWADRQPGVTLTSVAARPRVASVEPDRTLASAQGTATPKSAGEYEFDLGAHVPVDRVSLRLPELNTLVDAQFFARNDLTGVWQSVARGRLYRLKASDNDDLTNSPLAIPVTSARYWKVLIDAAGGGLGSGVPMLIAGWLPDQLLFVARGSPPFRLLYGNSSAPALRLTAASLIGDTPSISNKAQTLQAQPARLALPAVLGGEARLQPQTAAPDWKRWLLWSVLILGVAALGTMAWRLSRSLHAANDDQ